MSSAGRTPCSYTCGAGHDHHHGHGHGYGYGHGHGHGLGCRSRGPGAVTGAGHRVRDRSRLSRAHALLVHVRGPRRTPAVETTAPQKSHFSLCAPWQAPSNPRSSPAPLH
ncbi:hypothetical protein FIV42_18635 [Persicimonas caeni]|uniref:Uncharacterized protein n=1 Tax=Persicimonas caeni TaxID=2292766 RepID=A0A4Y6PWQ5_PERCE|nr:hypothetical protein FIV42_18635 [Persicimonas caeni]QED33905.1 hypothetical protein FRD00_18630 [Persicimonas caeni]